MEGCHESPTSIITDRPRAELWFSLPVLMSVSPYISYIASVIPIIPHNARVWDGGTVIQMVVEG